LKGLSLAFIEKYMSEREDGFILADPVIAVES